MLGGAAAQAGGERARHARHPILAGTASARFFHLLLLATFLTGVALRAWQLDIQILIDDEWHAIHKLLRASPVDILTHLGYADYSIPLTLYYQWLYRTIGLSEWGMHAPALVAGVALLVIGPRMLANWAPLATRAIWLGLVAVSPLLVYHSKIARPYALTSLLSFVAIVAFRAWWRGGRRGDAALYAGATFLAGWLHPITLPFTLLPFLFYGAQALAQRRPDSSAGEGGARSAGAAIARLAGLGIATALPLAIALAPPLVVDWMQFSQKAAKDAVTVESVYRTLLMLGGTGSPGIAVALGLCAVIGLRRLAQRDAELAWYLATVFGVGSVVVAASGAEWISHPLVLARYMLPALPFLLLFVADGIAMLVAHLRTPLLEAGLGACAAALLLATGPIPGEWHYPNQFWGHLRYQFDYDPAHNPYVQLLPKEDVPAFYRELGRLPRGSVTLIEAPWRLESHFNALSLYQDVHRQLVKIGLVTPLCGTYDFGEYPEERGGMKMRELVHLAAVLRGDARGADYLVLHPRAHNVAADPGTEWPDLARCMPAIAAALGQPAYRDDQIVVYKLAGLSPLGNNRRPVQQSRQPH
jgi:hypothetical protein